MSMLRGVMGAALLLPLLTWGANAQVVDDPLHGACLGGDVTCGADNNTITPITGVSGHTVSGFGFTASPAQSGDLDIVVLIPHAADLTAGITGLSVGGTNLSTELLTEHAGVFSSGDLDTFLGLSASPTNPFGAFTSSCTGCLDSTVTGFDVFYTSVLAHFTTDLPMPGDTLTDTYTLSGLTGTLPAGSIIVGFLENSSVGGTTATASSGQLDVDQSGGVPFGVVPVPEPKTALMFLPLLGFVFLLSRRRRTA